MATKDKAPKSQGSDEDILKIARDRFQLASEAEAELRRDALDDLKFSAGEQWPDDVKRSRDLDKRPCLTINRLPQFIRQITNDQRQNRPSIKVSPIDDQADVETAKIFQGIIRHIEYSSDADIAYDTAFDSAVRTGFGYFRVVTEYCDPMSFEQEIRIKRVRNRFSVYLDPSYQQPDGSDANWGFIFEDLSRDDFKAQFPSSKMASMDDWQSVGDSRAGWATSDTVRIAEYFFKDYKEVTLVMLQDEQGNKQVVDKAELPDDFPKEQILSERKSLVPTIKWLKINGVEVLEKTDWPGRHIPIIPVLGDELDIDGKKVLEGVIRHAKDPQRMYNYWASSETETIALAPRAPWIGVEGQFEGFENQWKTANVRNHAYLEYKAKSIGLQPVGPPQRNVFEPPVQAISGARMLASEDLKATTGIYDAALGAKSNENSGIAIQRRNVQSQTSNFHFMDNLTKSMRHCGRILVDLIPKIYDTARAIRILGEDGTEEIVRLNQVFERKGEMVAYDLSAGKYDVAVSTGPSFETKRQEAVASMADMTKGYPQLMQVAGDLMVKNMDWPGAQEIAERIKKTLPPGIAEDKDKKPLPPEVQQQMQQMNQMIEQLTKGLHAAHDELDKKKVEIESRERIEFAKMQTNLEIEMAKLGSQEAIVSLKEELNHLRARLEMVGFNQPIDFESDSAGGPQAAMAPTQVQQQPTGGYPSPGQPMGAP